MLSRATSTEAGSWVSPRLRPSTRSINASPARAPYAMLSRLSADENAVWHEASRVALEAGVLFTTSPFHCVVGRRPTA